MTRDSPARRLRLVITAADRILTGMAFDPSKGGYYVIYRPNETNHCPGCGRVQWYVGRLMSECAFCGTALEIEGARR